MQYTIRATDGATRVKANKKLGHSVQQAVHRLRSMVSVTLLWVLGHADIPGNETADILAKRGAKGVTSNKPIDKTSPLPDRPPPPQPERKRPPEPANPSTSGAFTGTEKKHENQKQQQADGQRNGL